MSDLLKTRDQEILLRNAHRMLRRTQQYRRQALWVFVSNITAFGAAYSDQVCRELGWNPNAPASDPLPPRAAQETGTGHRRNEPPVEFQVGDRVVLIVRDPSPDEPVGTVESNDFINMRGERLYHVAFPALGIAISVSAGQLQLANS